MTRNNPNKKIVKGVCSKCGHKNLWTKTKLVDFKCAKCGNTQLMLFSEYLRAQMKKDGLIGKKFFKEEEDEGNK